MGSLTNSLINCPYAENIEFRCYLHYKSKGEAVGVRWLSPPSGKFCKLLECFRTISYNYNFFSSIPLNDREEKEKLIVLVYFKVI